ncbi:MAG: ABC transporter permease [Bacteriovorax sp.]|jgi:peptide/nickel transport system permease protein|nr:ABC transporter permease [Bacteriovorax sp.]
MSKKITNEMKWGGSVLSLYVLWAFSWFVYRYFVKGTLLKPYTPELNMELELVMPFSKGLVLGADLLGRSLLEVLSAGLTYSLTISLIVTVATASIGIFMGYMAVKAPSWFKLAFDLLINLIFIFPSILIAIMIMAVTGQSMKGLIFALIITGWPGYAKIARGESKRVLSLTYVEGAKAIGIGEIRLFFRIIIPAILPVMIVNMVLGISGVIISEAALGFLGLGASPYSWGAMLSAAKTVLLEAPHIAMILSLTMAGLIIGLNLLGDGLRDYLDPKEN